MSEERIGERVCEGVLRRDRGRLGLVATGGRVLSVVATGSSFVEARSRVYGAVGRLSLDGSQHRTDIAAQVIR